MFKSMRYAGLALATLALPQLALAHAVLVSSNPAEWHTIYAGDLNVDLRFNSRVDGSHSTLTLIKPDGTRILLSAPTQPQPSELMAKGVTSVPGTYQVLWQALSADGHVSRGVVHFRVRD